MIKLKVSGMCVKGNLDGKFSTADFYYDLIDGGYLPPEKILRDKKDIENVNKAIETIRIFKKTCEHGIKDFIR